MKTKLKAGRELDALVAEHVMRWEEHEQYGAFSGDFLGVLWYDGDECRGDVGPEYAWSPSTEIADAWSVLEHLDDEWPSMRLCKLSTGGFICVLRHWNFPHGESDVETHAETAPLAICLAALKAVGAQ